MIVLVFNKTDVTFAGRRRFPFFYIAEWWRELNAPKRWGFGVFWERASRPSR